MFPTTLKLTHNCDIDLRGVFCPVTMFHTPQYIVEVYYVAVEALVHHCLPRHTTLPEEPATTPLCPHVALVLNVV